MSKHSPPQTPTRQVSSSPITLLELHSYQSCSPLTPLPSTSRRQLFPSKKSSSLSSPKSHALIDLTSESPLDTSTESPKRIPLSGAKSSKTGSKLIAPATSSFRMRAKNFFLTFPQCSRSKQDALTSLTQLPLSLKGAIVAKENHADGTPHLHIGVYLHEVLDTRDPRFFDSVGQKHGRYEVMRSEHKTILYCSKDDTDPLRHGILPTPPTVNPKKRSRSSEASSKSKSTTIAEAIQSGLTIAQVNAMDPGYCLLNLKKIEQYHSFCSITAAAASKESLSLPILYVGSRPATKLVIDWLNTNLGCERPLKSPQMYLYGPPNSSKTSLIMKLEAFLSVYYMPISEEFYDYYFDDLVQLIVLDEFKGSKTIQTLNQWLDGQRLTVRVKGAQRMKKTNHPFIILSNYSLQESYPNVPPSKLASLQARLTEIYLDEPIDLDNVLFNCSKEPVIEETDDDVLSPIL